MKITSKTDDMLRAAERNYLRDIMNDRYNLFMTEYRYLTSLENPDEQELYRIEVLKVKFSEINRILKSI